MSQGQKAFPVSWDQFHRDARALAWRLAESGPFGAIICITRGGLVPAAIVSRELGVRAEAYCRRGDAKGRDGRQGDPRDR